MEKKKKKKKSKSKSKTQCVWNGILLHFLILLRFSVTDYLLNFNIFIISKETTPTVLFLKI